MTTRYERLCAQVTADIIQRELTYGYGGIDEDTVFDIVDIFSELKAGNIYKHAMYYRSECEEMGDSEAKEILERLEALMSYSTKLQMGESYEAIDSDRFILQMSTVRTDDTIQYTILDKYYGEDILNSETNDPYFYGKTYSVPCGEAVNVTIYGDIYTFMSDDRVKE